MPYLHFYITSAAFAELQKRTPDGLSESQAVRAHVQEWLGFPLPDSVMGWAKAGEAETPEPGAADTT